MTPPLLDLDVIKSIRPPSQLSAGWPSSPEREWWRVEAPHLCAGLCAMTENGEVVDAAPILAWTVGKNIADVVRWVDRKGYKIELLKRQPR